MGVLSLLTWINARGLREGSMVQNVFTVLKVGAIALLVVIGFASGKGSASHFLPLVGTTLGSKGVAMGFMAALGVAMSKALFAYDAWNSVTFASEEIRNPERSLPRVLILGTAVTTLAYTASCAMYLYVLPIDEMAGVAENRVAAGVAHVLMGNTGVGLVSIAILVSTFGCANGLILAGARVLYAMSRDGLFFRFAGRIDPRRHTPRGALFLHRAWRSSWFGAAVRELGCQIACSRMSCSRRWRSRFSPSLASSCCVAACPTLRARTGRGAIR